MIKGRVYETAIPHQPSLLNAITHYIDYVVEND